jgi:putative flippase GtrA
MASKNISYHILPVAATMVGVCMTVISLVQLVPENAISSWADEILAIDALIFLASAWISYWTLRHEKQAERLEKIADYLFLSGLSVMGFVSVLVAFDLFLN